MVPKTYALYDKVEIHSTMSIKLDGLRCTILGIVTDYGTAGPDHYIVELPHTIHLNGYMVKAIQLTEACLKSL